MSSQIKVLANIVTSVIFISSPVSSKRSDNGSEERLSSSGSFSFKSGGVRFSGPFDDLPLLGCELLAGENGFDPLGLVEGSRSICSLKTPSAAGKIKTSSIKAEESTNKKEITEKKMSQ
jgi:hypothetical protein